MDVLETQNVLESKRPQDVHSFIPSSLQSFKISDYCSISHNATSSHFFPCAVATNNTKQAQSVLLEFMPRTCVQHKRFSEKCVEFIYVHWHNYCLVEECHWFKCAMENGVKISL